MDKKILILGAAGRLGLAAVRAFSSAGWQVVGQLRAGRTVDEFPKLSGVTWVPCNLDDRVRLLDAAVDSQVLIHGLNPAYTNRAWSEQAPQMMTQAIDLAAELGATLMLPGNVYNFGEDMPAELREDTPQHATHTKGRVRIALEEQLAAAAQLGRLRAVVIRSGDFFGSGRGTMFDLTMVNDLPKGRMSFAGERGVATAWAYLPDLARTFVQLAERRSALVSFEVFHFRGHTLNDADWRAVLGDVARARGWLPDAVGLRLGRFPWGLIRLGAPLVPAWRSLHDMRYLGQRPHLLNNAKLVDFLGGEPQTPFKEAVTAAIEDLFPQEPSIVRKHSA